MVLQINPLDDDDLPQLFKHSKEYSQGQGKIRIGAASAVIAKDGSGDFDNILEAIKDKSFTNYIIKEGTYNENLTISRAITLSGANWSAIITGDIATSQTITIQNLQIRGNLAIATTAPDCRIINNNFYDAIKTITVSNARVNIINNFFNSYNFGGVAIAISGSQGSMITGNYMPQSGSINLTDGNSNIISNNSIDATNLIFVASESNIISGNVTTGTITLDVDSFNNKIINNVLSGVTDNSNSAITDHNIGV